MAARRSRVQKKHCAKRARTGPSRGRSFLKSIHMSTKRRRVQRRKKKKEERLRSIGEAQSQVTIGPGRPQIEHRLWC